MPFVFDFVAKLQNIKQLCALPEYGRKTENVRFQILFDNCPSS